jgi:hypothetical protein
MIDKENLGGSKTSCHKFGEEADKFLQDFYKRFGSEKTQEKINLLQDKLGGTSNFYSLGGGSLTDEQKLACLEYEFLEKSGVIKVVLA